jgi:nuclear GTP-binding protein
MLRKTPDNTKSVTVPVQRDPLFAEATGEQSLNDPVLREKKKYMRELKKVIEASDIILEILDARDPQGCRNKEIEALIQSMPGEKKIILVVNKIDLVPM